MAFLAPTMITTLFSFLENYNSVIHSNIEVDTFFQLLLILIMILEVHV